MFPRCARGVNRTFDNERRREKERTSEASRRTDEGRSGNRANRQCRNWISSARGTEGADRLARLRRPFLFCIGGTRHITVSRRLCCWGLYSACLPASLPACLPICLACVPVPLHSIQLLLRAPHRSTPLDGAPSGGQKGKDILRAIESTIFRYFRPLKFRNVQHWGYFEKKKWQPGVEMQKDTPEKSDAPFTFITLFPAVTSPVLLGADPPSTWMNQRSPNVFWRKDDS